MGRDARRACEACALRAHKTLTDFLAYFEKKTNCFAVYTLNGVEYKYGFN